MHRRQSRDDDVGSATLEIAILGPALLLLIFTIVQTALWFYARNLALAAAQEGADAARSYGLSPAVGITRARSFLDRSAGDSLQGSAVSSAGSTPTRVHISVTGHALSVLPGVPGFPVDQSASAPVERFTGAGP